jgi:hypothetical protein
MVSFKSVITALLLIQISIGVINMTGIFTVQEDVNVIDSGQIANITDSLNSSANKDSSALDYFATLGLFAYNGLRLAMQFVVMAITGVPTILKLFLIPDPLADLLGYTVEVLLVLGIAYKLFTR